MTKNRSYLLIAALVVLAVVVFAFARPFGTGGTANGGQAQPSPHAIEQSQP